MMKLAERINRIEISSLWSGHKHIVWNLRPDVNVLSGRNGEGKSTILNKLIHHLRSLPTTGELSAVTHFGVKVEFRVTPPAFAMTCCGVLTARWW